MFFASKIDGSWRQKKFFPKRTLAMKMTRINRRFMVFGGSNKRTTPRIKTRFPILVFVLIVGMGVPVRAGRGSVLPDYETEARIVFQGMCDGGKVSYSTYYKQGDYVLEVARIVPEGSFYFIKRYKGKGEGWNERYFRQMNNSSRLHELAHEEWDENVKRASVNYFNKLHDLRTTCTKLLVS
jgi:hypothetical protein